jgi:hypothetical protein
MLSLLPTSPCKSKGCVMNRGTLSALALCVSFLASSTPSFAEDRYEFINAQYISRSEATRADQRMVGIFIIGDRNTGSVSNCLCSIVYNRNTGTIVERRAECKSESLGDAQAAPGRYTFFGPGKSRPISASGSPEFASINQEIGRLRFCAYREGVPGHYICIEAPLKF